MFLYTYHRMFDVHKEDLLIAFNWKAQKGNLSDAFRIAIYMFYAIIWN